VRAGRGGSEGCQGSPQGLSTHQFQHTFEVVSHHRRTHLGASAVMSAGVRLTDFLPLASSCKSARTSKRRV